MSGSRRPRHPLANGLRVATDRDGIRSRPSRSASGSMSARGNEPAEINGVAHLLEHMAFKGTERRAAPARSPRRSRRSAAISTPIPSREQTAYYAKVLKADLPLALDILADILQHSTFDAEELERERAVVLQEIGQAEDTPDDIIFDHFQERAFPTSRWAGRCWARPRSSAASRRETSPRLSAAPLRAGPACVLAAAGKVDHEKLVELAARGLRRAWPRAIREAPEPARYTRRRDPRASAISSRCISCWACRASAISTPTIMPPRCSRPLFGGGMSSRLFQEVREKRGLVYCIYSFAILLSSDGGLFGIYAGTGEKEAAESDAAAGDELNRLADDGRRRRSWPAPGRSSRPGS